MEKEKIADLVLQARRGNKNAFGQLYSETGRSVYFNCLKLLGNVQEAQDITQETFITALQKLDGLQFPENFSPWVNRIAINKCKEHFRKNPAAPEEQSEEIIDELSDTSFIPDDYADSEEKRRIIMDIIDKTLTTEQRQTVILYYFDMMSTVEIARIMECSEGTVTSRLSAARKKIREAVLIYEKKNDDRLHIIVPIPVLSKIFMEEAKTLALPKLSVLGEAAKSVSSNSQQTNDPSASAQNAVPDSNNNFSNENNAVQGGKSMSTISRISLKTKIIAGAIAAVIVAGGVIAAVVANSNKTSTDSRSQNAVQTADDINDVNEQDIEDKLNALDDTDPYDEDTNADADTNNDNSDGIEWAEYSVSEEMKSAQLSSGQLQLNNSIIQTGGYVKVSDFCAEVSDEYTVHYSDGTFDDKKDEMLDYRVGADMPFGGNWWDAYALTLIPKAEPQGDQITVYVANLTNPDGQTALADCYVVWAEETPMSNICYTPAWIPGGYPVKLSTEVLSTKDFSFDETTATITPEDVESFLKNSGLTEKADDRIAGNYLYYVYSRGDLSYSGMYEKNADGDVFVAYVQGEKNAAGLTPLYRYHFEFNNNTRQIDKITAALVDLF